MNYLIGGLLVLIVAAVGYTGWRIARMRRREAAMVVKRDREREVWMKLQEERQATLRREMASQPGFAERRGEDGGPGQRAELLAGKRV